MKIFDASKAKSYVSLAEKAEFIETNAGKCIEKCEIKVDGETFAPAMYKENVAKKQEIMMGALISLYLQEEYTNGDYDQWAQSHILNQIERAKGKGGETKDLCFDLLSDYKELGKMLNSEIYGMISCMNDTVSRMMATMAQSATPETMQKLLGEIENLKKDTEKLAKNG